MSDTLYPEHERQAAILDGARAIGEFLESGPYILAEYRNIEEYVEPRLTPVGKSIDQVLAEWFEIDLDKIEEEKRAMLASLAIDPRKEA